jgi:hypothetical protein
LKFIIILKYFKINYAKQYSPHQSLNHFKVKLYLMQLVAKCAVIR